MNFKIKKTIKNIYCTVYTAYDKSIMIEFCSLSKQIIKSIDSFNIKNKIIIAKLVGFIIKANIIATNTLNSSLVNLQLLMF